MARSLTFATLILAGSNILSKVLGLLRDFVLAQAGGTSWRVDAYNLAFTLPDLINHFLGAGLMSITLIPLITPALTKSDPKGRSPLEEASEIIHKILWPILVLVVVISIVCFVFMESIIPLLTSEPLAQYIVDEAVRYTRILLFAQVSFVGGGFFLAFQYARNNYVFPALAPLLYNMGIILGGVISIYWGDGSLDGFCWGVLIASLIGNFLVQVWGATKSGFVWSYPKVCWSPELRQYLLLTMPFLLAVGASFSSEFVYKYFDGTGEGDISSLGFGLRINMALVGVFGGAVGVAGYPLMARLCQDRNFSKVNELVFGTVEKIIVLLLPMCVITAALAEPLVRLYLGGGAFGEDSIARVSLALKYYLLSAIPMSALLIISRSFYAKKDTWTPSILTALAFLISLPLYSLMEEMGSIRVPIISSITVSLQFLSLSVMWIMKHPSRAYKGVIFTSLKLLLPSIALYYAAKAFSITLDMEEVSRLGLLFYIPLVFGVSLIGFLVMIFPLKIDALFELINKVWHKVSSQKSSHTT